MKILTPSENILKTLKGKKVLFLENDTSLNDGLDCFEQRLIENEIEYKTLFNLEEVPFDDILKSISECDCIVFMTQWVYEASKKIKEYMFALKDKKIVIEVYICEPTWYYKPRSAHDVYIYSCYRPWKSDPIEDEKFYKLSQKPYWDYKNKFNR
ncbi:MAG TPA: hypothetical protein VMZ91_00025 [Candidatus Paceibacterota bacterium]|nr:hypothetical protein [Candidatus Paceibacterota bacterium]